MPCRQARHKLGDANGVVEDCTAALGAMSVRKGDTIAKLLIRCAGLHPFEGKSWIEDALQMGGPCSNVVHPQSSDLLGLKACLTFHADENVRCRWLMDHMQQHRQHMPFLIWQP